MILLIEDDRSNADLLKIWAHNVKFDLITSFDGSNALDLLEEYPIEMILLDLHLPNGNDGWQIAERIRTYSNYRHLPIIAISVCVDPDDQRRALSAGCNRFLAKPYTLKELLTIVNQYLPHRSV